MASAATRQWGKEVPLEVGMGGREERGEEGGREEHDVSYTEGRGREGEGEG